MRINWRPIKGRPSGIVLTLAFAASLFAQAPVDPLFDTFFAAATPAEAQAAAEEANARRLERLVDEGAELVREALKNPEFEANTLEQLAEDIQTLADIAESRMPGVADLLAKAASAAKSSGKPSEPRHGPQSGLKNSRTTNAKKRQISLSLSPPARRMVSRLSPSTKACGYANRPMP